MKIFFFNWQIFAALLWRSRWSKYCFIKLIRSYLYSVEIRFLFFLIQQLYTVGLWMQTLSFLQCGSNKRLLTQSTEHQGPKQDSELKLENKTKPHGFLQSNTLLFNHYKTITKWVTKALRELEELREQRTKHNKISILLVLTCFDHLDIQSVRPVIRSEYYF